MGMTLLEIIEAIDTIEQAVVDEMATRLSLEEAELRKLIGTSDNSIRTVYMRHCKAAVDALPR